MLLPVGIIFAFFALKVERALMIYRNRSPPNRPELKNSY